MPIDVKPDLPMLEKLRRAASVTMTAEQRRQQRVSFIHGGLSHDSTLTHADIARILHEREGADA